MASSSGYWTTTIYDRNLSAFPPFKLLQGLAIIHNKYMILLSSYAVTNTKALLIQCASSGKVYCRYVLVNGRDDVWTGLFSCQRA